ncbi:MAG: argininosuccinate lyase [Oscillospiraceae bacterium]|nr:argininosuccinate lyase [Oscillospiraceae bacterium]MDD7292062.1 argininosuccinate lyase [Clostridiaceae bacterium]MDY5991871.1 argininosuccinate lyase [Oscillospiraceae bacterium]
MPLWTGRFKKQLDKKTNDFNSSISFDCRMASQDIKGSIAHATMLGKQNIIEKSESEKIVSSLKGIAADLESGKLEIDMSAEDIHTFVEGELTKRLGSTGKRLHTARSRNDQVALDLRLYLLDEIEKIDLALKEFIDVILKKAKENYDAVMPGYTHLQRAQPVTFGHHLMAYTAMLLRDRERLADCKRRTAVSPLGSGALAGTTYPLDREYAAELLGLSGVCANSLDGVSDRDYVIELLSCLSLVMVHLSRFAEEVVMWCSWEFRFIELDDAFSTGSSIMPQKKNPDIAELVRGKSGRVFGSLVTLLTVMKGLPLAYNKDMQEDKQAVFDAVDTVLICIDTFAAMLDSAKVLKANMRAAAAKGFINATDCADYLVKKGLPFRDAYKAVGELVAFCIENGYTLETLPLEEYRRVCELFADDVYAAIDLDNCVKGRDVKGGPAPQRVLFEIENAEKLNK